MTVSGLDGKPYKVVKEVYGKYNERIAEYWKAIPRDSYEKLMKTYANGASRLDGTLRNLPWSAAFISWCMKSAGAGAAFPYASGHATWIVASIKAVRDGNTTAALQGFRPGERALTVGDLVGWNRGADKVTYDTVIGKGWFQSHSDIVVEVDKTNRVAWSTGGNVGQSVSRRDLPIDKDGKLTTRSVLVHIVNNIGAADLVVASAPLLENFG